MNLTRWVIVFSVLLICGIDIILAVFGGIESTISFQITEWSHGYPAIPFAFGFLMGHFFAQNNS